MKTDSLSWNVLFWWVVVAVFILLISSLYHSTKIEEIEETLKNSYVPITTDKSMCEFDKDYVPDTGMGVTNP